MSFEWLLMLATRSADSPQRLIERHVNLESVFPVSRFRFQFLKFADDILNGQAVGCAAHRLVRGMNFIG